MQRREQAKGDAGDDGRACAEEQHHRIHPEAHERGRIRRNDGADQIERPFRDE